MTKIKICGITRVEDAKAAADLGADFLGLVFVESSPRAISPERAAEIVEQVQGPRFVGVFRDASVEYMAEVARVSGIHLVQLHGNEPEDVVREVGLPVIKAVRVEETLPPVSHAAEWMLFDSGGGTGRTFDWSLLADYPRTRPFFLAGGITLENVEQAMASVRPDGIDASSGVEVQPGIKDRDKVRELIERVRRA